MNKLILFARSLADVQTLCAMFASDTDAVIFECGHIVQIRDAKDGDWLTIYNNVFVKGRCPYCRGVFKVPEHERLITEQDLLTRTVTPNIIVEASDPSKHQQLFP